MEKAREEVETASRRRDLSLLFPQEADLLSSRSSSSVNLGGWLNTEPFIVPALYEKYYPEAIDEWTLSVAMGANLATEMEEHYKTFVTERDFMEIAAAGMNWVRM